MNEINEVVEQNADQQPQPEGLEIPAFLRRTPPGTEAEQAEVPAKEVPAE